MVTAVTEVPAVQAATQVGRVPVVVLASTAGQLVRLPSLAQLEVAPQGKQEDRLELVEAAADGEEVLLEVT